MRMGSESIGWALAGSLAILGWACSGSLPHPTYVPQPTSALTSVPIPPPPARVEAIPPKPSAKGAVWVDGEWSYRRGRWAWVLGRWVVPPPDAAFSPWTVVRDADGDLFHAPGTWRDREGRAIDPPPALAVANAQGGPVVDAEGLTEITGRTMKNAEMPVMPAMDAGADAAVAPLPTPPLFSGER